MLKTGDDRYELAFEGPFPKQNMSISISLVRDMEHWNFLGLCEAHGEEFVAKKFQLLR